MKYEEPNLWIFMIEDADIICSSGDGLEIAPGVVPDVDEDNGGYH